MCCDFDPYLAPCVGSPDPVSNMDMLFISAVESRLSHQESLS